MPENFGPVVVTFSLCLSACLTKNQEICVLVLLFNFSSKRNHRSVWHNLSGIPGFRVYRRSRPQDCWKNS